VTLRPRGHNQHRTSPCAELPWRSSRSWRLKCLRIYPLQAPHVARQSPAPTPPATSPPGPGSRGSP
jgi:hypothetical protein